MRLYMIPAFAAAAVALGACKNGPNNARDTTGMPNNSAAGSVGPGSGLGPGATTNVAAPVDTMRDTMRDTTRDTTRKRHP